MIEDASAESSALAPLASNSRFDLAYDQTYEYDNNVPFDSRDEEVVDASAVIQPVIPDVDDAIGLTERTQPDSE